MTINFFYKFVVCTPSGKLFESSLLSLPGNMRPYIQTRSEGSTWRLSRILASTKLSISRSLQVVVGHRVVGTWTPTRGKRCQPARRGYKWRSFSTHTRGVKSLCRKRIVLAVQRLLSLLSTLRDDFLHFQEHIMNSIQESGDMVLFFSLTGHCV